MDEDTRSGVERWWRWLGPLAIAALAILAWDLVIRLNGIPPYILPGPGLVARVSGTDVPTPGTTVAVTVRGPVVAFG